MFICALELFSLNLELKKSVPWLKITLTSVE